MEKPLLALWLLAAAPSAAPPETLDCTAGAYLVRLRLSGTARVGGVMLYERDRPFLYLARELAVARVDRGRRRLDLAVKPRAAGVPAFEARARGREGTLRIRSERHPLRCQWR